MLSSSCKPRRQLDVADYGYDLLVERATDGHLSLLESDLTRMADDTRPDVDQAALDACE